MDEAEEVFDVVFPAGDKAAKGVQPSEQPLNLPPSAIAAQLAAVLGATLAPAPVGGDQLDAVLLGELRIEPVGVIRFVADEPGRKLIEEASGQNSFHKPAFGRRSAFDSNGERKTVVRSDSNDFRALAPTGGTDGKPPFFALAKVASTNASSRFSLPCSCKSAASRFSNSSSLPERIHCWKRRWQV